LIALFIPHLAMLLLHSTFIPTQKSWSAGRKGSDYSADRTDSQGVHYPKEAAKNTTEIDTSLKKQKPSHKFAGRLSKRIGE